MALAMFKMYTFKKNPKVTPFDKKYVNKYVKNAS